MANPTNLADGDIVTETWVDAIRAQVNLIYASTGARDADLTVPFPGQRAYIASNNGSEGPVERNSAGKWDRPWNMPWGLMALNTPVTSPQTGVSSTATDLTGMSVTWTAVANRRYRVMAKIRCQQRTSAAAPGVLITDSANVVQNSDTFSLAIDSAAMFAPVAFVAPAAGAVTYKCRATTGLGTLDTQVSSTQPGLMWVEDLGPSGAPA